MSFIKYLCAFSLLFGISASAAIQTSKSIASELYSSLEKKVFRVRTALDKDAPKASYGSGFIVGKDGLLLTNYHVVSTALQKYQKYKIYVDIGGVPYLAKILEIDVNNDLSLLKVDRKFQEIIQIRKKSINHGGKIFSMGIPEDLGLSITEGIYNGIKKNGPYENIHMSNPINSGMSGGPVVDVKGRLVGVNVSVLRASQNISFAVPKKSIEAILKRYRKRGKKKIQFTNTDSKEVDKEIKRQLLVAQQGLMDDLLMASKDVKKEDSWEYAKNSKELKCWQVDKSDKSKNRYSGKKEICYVPNSSYIRSGIYSGTYEIKYLFLSSNRLTGVKFYNYLSNKYNRGASISSWFISGSSKDNYTKYECDEEILINKFDLSFRTSYCLRGYVDYKSIYDIDFKAITLLKKNKALLVSFELRGFTKENINKFTKTIMDKIRFKDNANN